MKRLLKIILRVVIFAIVAVLLFAVGYIAYVFASYKRIDDNVKCDIVNKTEEQVETNKEYTFVTYNVGFGAYCQDFTFFMDGGKESRARSKELMLELIDGAGNLVKTYDPDFIAFQEVDINSTRTFNYNQVDELAGIFNTYSYTYAVNYDSAYLLYPITKPHGKSKSSLMTLSKFKMEDSLRRQLPISTSFTKILDLDRAFDVVRYKVGEHELVIINTHMSAYGGSDEIRTSQMTMVFETMQSEYEKGNWVICAGDFNHDFTGNSTETLNPGVGVQDYGWAQPFPIDLLNQYTGLVRQTNYNNGELKPTCRNNDVPYVVGNQVFIVDGFITSVNVEVTSLENISTDFIYSDHNPVVMKFILK